MLSITTILISITVMIAISEETLDMSSDMYNQTKPQISYPAEFSHLKLTVAEYSKLYSMQVMRPLHTSFDEFQKPPAVDITKKHIDSRQEIRRKRRDALHSMIGRDDGRKSSASQMKSTHKAEVPVLTDYSPHTIMVDKRVYNNTINQRLTSTPLEPKGTK